MSTDERELISDESASSAERPAETGIDMSKGASGEFHEVLVKVGPGGVRRQRFFGRAIGESRQFTKVGIQTVRVWVSRKGKFVVQVRRSEWADLSEMTNLIKDWKNWRTTLGTDDFGWGDYTVDVLDSVEELRDRVPERIYRALADAAGKPYTEDINA
ncbi:EXLDI protein [Nocardia sp. KC 131]|uniref:EXLDI protein n=1 Tax=Nocardia arseniciresistens TaxID=3392119 RepID=UPI00398E8DD4